MAPFNIASSVNLITAQTAARRLCSPKKPADIPSEALLDAGFTEENLDGGWQTNVPVGCTRFVADRAKGARCELIE